LLFFG